MDSEQILNAEEIDRCVAQLAAAIEERFHHDPLRSAGDDCSLVLVGIKTGGAHLAHRLSAALNTAHRVGLLDITLYRDDVFAGGNMPRLLGTEIDFDIRGTYVVIVDDVLFTGRTVRAALDALLDLGRPRCMRLCVLIDRGLRELPVAPDFVARSFATKSSEHIRVALVGDCGVWRVP